MEELAKLEAQRGNPEYLEAGQKEPVRQARTATRELNRVAAIAGAMTAVGSTLPYWLR